MEDTIATPHHPRASRPLVLLDVDGVINDLGHLRGFRRPWETRVVTAGGFDLHIPAFMPELIGSLARHTEIHWCTTWLDDANTHIAPLLGVGPFPVIGDDHFHGVDWKAQAARDLAVSALAAGRPVFWIEDFYEELPEPLMPAGVVYVDTATAPGGPVLTRDLLPPELQAAIT